MTEKKIVALNQLEKLAKRTKEESDKLKAKIEQLQLAGGGVTKASQLDNDLGFQTAEQVRAIVAQAEHLERKIVKNVGEIDPSGENAEKYIYLVPDADGDNSSYAEYMVINGKAEKVGDWKVDLSDYVQKHDDDRLMTAEEGKKLSAIADGATRVEAGSANGKIKINGVDTEVYTLPGTVLTELDVADDSQVIAMLDEVFTA